MFCIKTESKTILSKKVSDMTSFQHSTDMDSKKFRHVRHRCYRGQEQGTSRHFSLSDQWLTYIAFTRCSLSDRSIYIFFSSSESFEGKFPHYYCRQGWIQEGRGNHGPQMIVFSIENNGDKKLFA